MLRALISILLMYVFHSLQQTSHSFIHLIFAQFLFCARLFSSEQIDQEPHPVELPLSIERVNKQQKNSYAACYIIGMSTMENRVNG